MQSCWLEEVAMNQGKQAPLEAGKSEKTDCPPEPPERNAALPRP